MQTYLINFVVPVSSWEVYLFVNYSSVRNIVIQFESIVVSIERKLLKFISKMLVIEEQVREQSHNEFAL
jgi:hypothetical protein